MSTASLPKIAVLRSSNASRSLKKRDALRPPFDQKIEDCDIVVAGAKKLSAQRAQLKTCCESLEAELVQTRSDTDIRVSNLETKVRSAEARNVEIAADGKKILRDFENAIA
jgi:hypothetical protein